MLKLNIIVSILLFSAFLPQVVLADYCQRSDGTIVENYTQSECQSRGGNWTQGDPPSSNGGSFIPGVDKNSSIPEYIKAIYTYAIGVVGILATVVIMIGGLIWISSMGNAARVNSAKEWIGAALTGLALAMFSYTILYIINPDTVNFRWTAPQQVNTDNATAQQNGQNQLYQDPIKCKRSGQTCSANGECCTNLCKGGACSDESATDPCGGCPGVNARCERTATAYICVDY